MGRSRLAHVELRIRRYSYNMRSNPIVVFLVSLALLIVAVYAGYTLLQQGRVQREGVVCTQEAKQCPDGSYVGRSGPQCEFAACPRGNASWLTATTNPAVTFEYPGQLTASEYLQAVDWPPQVQLIRQPFMCVEGGVETARAGRTSHITVNGHSYCVTKESEGAAGSIYTNYAYAFGKGESTLIFTFSTRKVQCANYEESRQGACQQDQDSFDLNDVLDRMAESTVLK